MEQLLAFLTRERDRQAVRDALAGKVDVHFVGQAAELHRPRPDGAPAGVLAELLDAERSSLERALEALQRLAPAVPIWLYIAPQASTVREAVRLTTRGLVADVISTGENLGVRLLELLRRSHTWSEVAALRSVWEEAWTPDTRDIMAACIAASSGAATVEDVAHRVNKSPRALERQVSRAGLPPARRIISWCRLLRAMYRLEQAETNVKTVAEELGFRSAHAMVKHLHRHTGLTITGLRAVGGFTGLAAYIQAELLIMRARGRRRAHRHRVTHHRG
jgi:AraC-like DNA-binding protein